MIWSRELPIRFEQLLHESLGFVTSTIKWGSATDREAGEESNVSQSCWLCGETNFHPAGQLFSSIDLEMSTQLVQ
jgi:hypothetical protein